MLRFDLLLSETSRFFQTNKKQNHKKKATDDKNIGVTKHKRKEQDLVQEKAKKTEKKTTPARHGYFTEYSTVSITLLFIV